MKGVRMRGREEGGGGGGRGGREGERYQSLLCSIGLALG